MEKTGKVQIGFRGTARERDELQIEARQRGYGTTQNLIDTAVKRLLASDPNDVEGSDARETEFVRGVLDLARRHLSSGSGPWRQVAERADACGMGEGEAQTVLTLLELLNTLDDAGRDKLELYLRSQLAGLDVQPPALQPASADK